MFLWISPGLWSINIWCFKHSVCGSSGGQKKNISAHEIKNGTLYDLGDE